MKKMNTNNFIVLLLLVAATLLTNKVTAQEDTATKKETPKELVTLKYFNENNGLQYLMLTNFLKTGKKIEPQKNKVFKLYLDSSSTTNLIGTVTTDEKGRAKSFIPPSLKVMWDVNTVHKFIAVANGKEEDAAAEIEIAKARIKIDTSSEENIKSITVLVTKFENNEWVPASEVEMKIGIQRHGGILTAGEAATYTTDSSGTAMVQLNKDSLPGDIKGNIILAASVEDNDLFGNLMVEKTVPWGVSVITAPGFFDQRTLWSTRFRTPIWLLVMAYSIVIGVWGTIIYLVLQIIKIKKLGKDDYPVYSGIDAGKMIME
jgi:hypothetical protein